MANKRVIDLPDLSQDVQEGQYILVDSSGGTGKMDLKRIVDDAGSFEPAGEYPDLYAGNLTTDKSQTDTAPYLLRRTGGNLSRIGERCYPVLVGASVAENQLVSGLETSTADGITTEYDSTTHEIVITNNSRTTNYGFGSARGTVTATISGHVYVWYFAPAVTGLRMGIPSQADSTPQIFRSGGQSLLFRVSSTYDFTTAHPIGDVTRVYATIIDLTQLLGSTIADYVYTLEQATAGSGIAWLRSYGFITDDYKPYNTGTIESIEATAKIVRDENGENAVTYPLGNDVLRGIFKLDASNKLYADGDRKEADGTITRRYGVVDLGTRNWSADNSNGLFISPGFTGAKYIGYLQCAKYLMYRIDVASTLPDKCIVVGNSQAYPILRIKDTAYAGQTGSAFKEALSGVLLIYELATPTTEQSTPFVSAQTVYPDGTEEFVTENNVPVGHETSYPYDLKGLVEGLIDVPDVPSTNGTYVLKATRSASGIVYNWVTG